MSDPSRERSSFFEQLKRRWVTRVGIAHAAAAYKVPRLYVLGKTLEAEGDADGALTAWRRFVAILDDADPDLPVRARIDAARAALARLEQR